MFVDLFGTDGISLWQRVVSPNDKLDLFCDNENGFLISILNIRMYTQTYKKTHTPPKF